LSDLDLAGGHPHLSRFVDMNPRRDLGRESVAPLRPSGFLREQIRRGGDDHEAAAEEADELAALELERVAPRLRQLVAVGFEGSRFEVRGFGIHRAPPVAVDVERIFSAARRIACTMRGCVPQRQTFLSIRRAMSCPDGLGLVLSIPTVAMIMPDVQ